MSEPRSMDDDQANEPTGQPPEFGPSGYLPERASKRARKIVLRAPLGLQWVVASLLAGVAVIVAAVLFLGSSSGPPGAPYERVAGLDELPDLVVTEVAGREIAILTAGGRPRAFAVADGPDELTYCADANRLVAGGERVWLPTGRGLGGGASLAEHPILAHDGVLYVDPTRTVPGPPPSDDPATVPSGCG